MTHCIEARHLVHHKISTPQLHNCTIAQLSVALTDLTNLQIMSTVHFSSTAFSCGSPQWHLPWPSQHSSSTLSSTLVLYSRITSAYFMTAYHNLCLRYITIIQVDPSQSCPPPHYTIRLRCTKQTRPNKLVQRRQHLRLAAPIPLGYEFTAREDFNFGTLRPTELAQFQTPTVYEEASDSTVPVERYAPTPLNRSRYLWTDGMQHDNRVAEMSSEPQEGVNDKDFGGGEYNEGAEEEKREEAEEAEEEEEEEEEDCKETRVDLEEESREPVTLPQEETEGETLGQAVDFQFEDEMHEL